MRVMRRTSLVAVGVAVVVALAECGSGSGGASSSASASASSTNGHLVVAVASFDVHVSGPRRFLVGLFRADQTGIAYGAVHERFTYLGNGTPGTPGPSLTGTFLAVPGTASAHHPTGPAALPASKGRGVYATTVAFDRAGHWRVDVQATVDGKSERGSTVFDVAPKPAVPDVGQAAPASDNATLSTPGVPPAAIDSRAAEGPIPDPELHRSSIAQALAAHRPAVVVFATPVYCTSRFCGPITDLVQQLADQYADRATFVHVEIWRDFQNQTLNPAAQQWLVAGGGGGNEPWVFVIGADGKIVARFDNVATRGELEPILQALPVIGPAK